MGASYPSTTYSTMGDSTFNGFTYRKIGRLQNMGAPWQPEDLTYTGSIRDEGGRWLFVPVDSEQEYTLVDLSGEIGDTVTIHNPFSTDVPVDYVVDGINTVLPAADERRMWTLSPPEYPGFQDHFIEGIGSTYGLFGHAIFLSDVGSQLVCMEQDGELIYRIPEAESCYYLYTGLAERIAVPFLRVMPNPARDQVTLTVADGTLHVGDLSLYDALGRVLDLKSLVGNGTELHLDLSSLPDGLYTVCLAKPDQPLVHVRLVVQR